MSQVVGRVLAILGLIILLVTAGLLAKNAIDINQLHAVSIANRSSNFFNPVYEVATATGLGVVAGLLLGMGLILGSRRIRRGVAVNEGTAVSAPGVPPRN